MVNTPVCRNRLVVVSVACRDFYYCLALMQTAQSLANFKERATFPDKGRWLLFDVLSAG